MGCGKAPDFRPQNPEYSHDAEGWRSCVSYGFAMAVDDRTCGVQRPTGNQIRDWTGDHSGGLELDACDLAVTNHLHINFITKVMTWATFTGLLASGNGAVVIGGYGPIARSKFSGQDGFTGNHGIYVPPSHKVMDPLADGRRAGVYKYHGEVYPLDLIHQFTSALRVKGGGTAGSNHVECSYIHIPTAPAPAPTTHRATVKKGSVWFYSLHADGSVASRHSVQTGGFQGQCTPPTRHRWAGYKSRAMVQMRTGAYSKGAYAHQYLGIENPIVTVKEM
jgi:hypothetical protein